MPYYWVEQTDGKRGCVVGDAATAERFGKILGTLPYPASPILERGNDNCPPFCWTPDACLNHGSCHRNRACDD